MQLFRREGSRVGEGCREVGMWAVCWTVAVEPSRPGPQAGSEAVLGEGDTGRK